MTRTVFVILCISVFCLSVPAEAQTIPTNERLFAILAADALRQVVDSAGYQGVEIVPLNFHHGALTQYFRTSMLGLLAKQKSVAVDPSGKAGLSVQIQKLSVAYCDRFSDGLFEPVRTTRAVEILLDALAVDSSGSVRWSGTIRRSATDTVEVDDIERLEQSTAQFAKGTAPVRTILERLVEPALVIGAAGIAVYLFFTIRS